MTLRNQFMTRESEAPAEPWRRQLGRSLALPFFQTIQQPDVYAARRTAAEFVKPRGNAKG